LKYPLPSIATQHAGIVFEGILDFQKIVASMTVKGGIAVPQMTAIANLFQAIDSRMCGEVCVLCVHMMHVASAVVSLVKARQIVALCKAAVFS
jgi:hypothetical protein